MYMTAGGNVFFDQLGFRINATGWSDPGAPFYTMCVGLTHTVASLSATSFMLIGVLMVTGSFAVTRRYVSGDNRSAD
jgi:hypothetical protein